MMSKPTKQLLLCEFVKCSLQCFMASVSELMHASPERDCLSSTAAFEYRRVCSGGHTLHQMSAVAIDFHVGHVQDPVYFEAESG